MSELTLTVEDFARRYMAPAVDALRAKLERENPELMKRLRRNARRRARYAERKTKH